MARYLTTNQLSERLGYATRTIRDWTKSGLPCDKKPDANYYDESEVLDWVAVNRANGATPRNRKSATDIDAADMTYARWKVLDLKAQKEQMELDKTRGLLLTKEEVEQNTLKKIQIVKQGLMRFRSQLARLEGLALPDMESIYDQLVSELLTEFSKT